MTTKYFDTKEQYITFRNAWAKAAQEKKITATHMMVYNAIRGKELHHGFTPVTNANKLINGMSLNVGLAQAWSEYNRMIQRMEKTSYWTKRAEEFVEPFGDAFTIEDLKQIQIDKIDPLWANYGKGLRLKEKIIEGARPTTFEELYALDMEDAA